MAAVDDELLRILACPFCKAEVRLEGEKILCTNAACGCRYLIKDEIPVMLIDEAERPCPKCGTQRDWNEDVLSCSKCGARLEVGERAPRTVAG